MRPDAGLFGGGVKPRRSRYIIAVEYGEGREPQLGRGCRQLFGYGGSFEEAEGRAAVEFDVLCIRHLFAVPNTILRRQGTLVNDLVFRVRLLDARGLEVLFVLVM